MSHVFKEMDRWATVAAGAGLLLVGSFVVASAMLGSVGADVRAFQGAYLAGYAGYAVLVWLLVRRDGGLPWGWAFWFVVCVVVRVIPFGFEPSDDIHRYVWEGRIQHEGVNPYSVAPADARLVPLRDSSWERINHRSYTAIYPPLSQMMFRLVTWVRPTVGAMKVCCVALDVAVVGVLMGWLRRAGRDMRWSCVYGLNPLVLTSFGLEAHADSLMLLFVALAGWWVAGGRLGWAAAAVACAISAKIVSLGLVGWLVFRRWWSAVVIVGLVALAYGVYADAGWSMFASLSRFSTERHFFALAYPRLEEAIGSGTAARATAAGCLAIVCAGLLWRRVSFVAFGAVFFGALLLLMPVVHYWYVTWVLVWQPFRLRISWLVLGVLMVFYFEGERVRVMTGTWSMPTWAATAVFVPFLVVWVLEQAWRLRRRA